MDPQFWLNLPAQYDLALAEESVGAKLRFLPTAAGDERRGHAWLRTGNQCEATGRPNAGEY